MDSRFFLKEIRDFLMDAGVLTSTGSGRILAEEGLKILAEIRDEFGLKIVTEAIDVESVDLVEKYSDIIQIGARNIRNLG